MVKEGREEGREGGRKEGRIRWLVCVVLKIVWQQDVKKVSFVDVTNKAKTTFHCVCSLVLLVVICLVHDLC